MPIPRPREPIARALFDALDAEMAHRDQRKFPDWIDAERAAIHREATRLAGRDVPLERIEDAERSACGHVDYMLKYAYRVAEIVREFQA